MLTPVFSSYYYSKPCDEFVYFLCFSCNAIDSYVIKIIFGSVFIKARDAHAEYLNTKISSCMNDFKIKIKTFSLEFEGNTPSLIMSKFYFIVISTFYENQLLKVIG